MTQEKKVKEHKNATETIIIILSFFFIFIFKKKNKKYTIKVSPEKKITKKKTRK